LENVEPGDERSFVVSLLATRKQPLLECIRKQNAEKTLKLSSRGAPIYYCTVL